MLSSDLFTVQAIVAILVVAVVVINLVVDLLYGCHRSAVCGWPASRGEARLAASIGAWIGIGFLTLLAMLAVLGDRLWFVRSFDERVRVGDEIANQYALGPGRIAWFGTDALGPDIFAKCLYGARTTLVVGVLATLVGLGLGWLLGIVAGYRRGATDRFAGMVTDALLSTAGDRAGDRDDRQARTPSRRPKPGSAGSTGAGRSRSPSASSRSPRSSRIVRARTLALREAEYVLAARSIGATTSRDPACARSCPTSCRRCSPSPSPGLGLLVAAEGALAFLGLSVEAPTPTWGKLIDQNRNAM